MKAKMNRQAVLCIQSWAGRTERKVIVIGETTKRYRIQFADDTPGRSNYDMGAKGETKLVPKYAVRFTDQ